MSQLREGFGSASLLTVLLAVVWNLLPKILASVLVSDSRPVCAFQYVLPNKFYILLKLPGQDIYFQIEALPNLSAPQ